MRWKWFGKDVSKLLTGTYWQQSDLMLEDLFTNKVTIKLDVFRSFMKNGIGGNVDACIIVTIYDTR